MKITFPKTPTLTAFSNKQMAYILHLWSWSPRLSCQRKSSMQFLLPRTALYICKWWFIANSFNLLDIQKNKLYYTLELIMVTIYALNIHMKSQPIRVLEISFFLVYLTQCPGWSNLLWLKKLPTSIGEFWQRRLSPAFNALLKTWSIKQKRSARHF